MYEIRCEQSEALVRNLARQRMAIKVPTTQTAQENKSGLGSSTIGRIHREEGRPMKRESNTNGRRGNPMVKRNRKYRASDEILRRLAVNLKRLRTERGYTQQKLAQLATVNVRRMRACERKRFRSKPGCRRAAARVNAGYISRVEHALVNISLERMEALQRSLECTVYDLLRAPRKHARPEVRRSASRVIRRRREFRRSKRSLPRRGG